MTTFSPLEALPPVLWSRVAFLAWATAGLLVYAALLDRAVFEDRGQVRSQCFGPLDAFIVAVLVLWFASVALSGLTGYVPASGAPLPDGRGMIAGAILGAVIFGGIIAGFVGGLAVRNLPWREALGLRRTSGLGVLGRAGLLIVLAVPLVAAAITLTRVFLTAAGRGGGEVQDIVRFLATPGLGAARVVVAVSAVFVAPFQEELIFRGYLYGVLRRYFGITAGVLINALLFAGIHQNAASFGGLFVLAVCLTLAYEWTGSIFVPMTMHALFNAFTVVNLFRGAGG